MPDFRDSIGALWVKQSRAGADYMSGEITIDGVKRRIVIFANNKRPDKRDPDWRIYPDQEQGQGAGGGGDQSRRNQAQDASREPEWMRDEEQPPFG